MSQKQHEKNIRKKLILHSLRLTDVLLISINELSENPHNAALKCFASEKQERQKGYKVLMQNYSQLIPTSFKLLLWGLSKINGEYIRFIPEPILKRFLGKEKK